MALTRKRRVEVMRVARFFVKIGRMLLAVLGGRYVFFGMRGILDLKSRLEHGYYFGGELIIIYYLHARFYQSPCNCHLHSPNAPNTPYSTLSVCPLNWYTLPTSITGLGFISTNSLALAANLMHRFVDRELPITKAKVYSLSFASPPYRGP